jgi:hypothetical protein
MTAAGPATTPGADLARPVRGQLMMLGFSFLLGLAVALIGMPSEVSGFAKVASWALLGLHVLVGIGLIAVSFQVMAAAPAGSAHRGDAVAGVVVIVATVLVGGARMGMDSDWLSYLMGVGFLAAFFLYGRLALAAAAAPAS